MKNIKIINNIKKNELFNFFYKKNINGVNLERDLKGFDKVLFFLHENGFLVKRFGNSDLIKFLKNYPFEKNKKKLSMHSYNKVKNYMILSLKEDGILKCFSLSKKDDFFVLKNSKDLNWVFNKKGVLVKREEHKKVKIWFAKYRITDDLGKTDLEKSITNCDFCHSKTLFRFRRSYRENILDLQCKCNKNYRVLFEEEKNIFHLMTSRKILKSFDKDGKII
jgi:hypothetical protein